MSRGPVKIERYDTSWPIQYERYERKISEKLQDLIVQIAHVGSTSIEGLAAKPIIDIAVTTNDIDNKAIIERMQDLGYDYNDQYENELPFRRYFILKEGNKHLVHVHVVPVNHQFFEDHIIFRDYLRKNTDIRDEYVFLKTRLANKHREDREGYQNGKDRFIKMTLEMARDNDN